MGLSTVVKCYARKMVKRTHFLSSCKMVNFVLECCVKFSSKNMSSIGRGIAQCHDTKISRTSAKFMVLIGQLKLRNHLPLRLQINALCIENEVFGITSSLQNIRSFNIMRECDSWARNLRNRTLLYHVWKYLQQFHIFSKCVAWYRWWPKKLRPSLRLSFHWHHAKNDKEDCYYFIFLACRSSSLFLEKEW